MSRTFLDAKGIYKISDDWKLTLEGRARFAGDLGDGSYVLLGVDLDVGGSITLGVVDDVSPDLKRLTLQLLGQTVSTTSVAPPNYPVGTGGYFAASIDYDPTTRTATARINGTQVLTLTYSGSLPAATQITRAFAAKLTESLGQAMVVENKPGVNGMLGAWDYEVALNHFIRGRGENGYDEGKANHNTSNWLQFCLRDFLWVTEFGTRSISNWPGANGGKASKARSLAASK